MQNRTFPLDYIMKIPKFLKKSTKLSDYELRKSLRLENIFKNIVMRRITEIREEKAKPSLKDMVE